MYNSRHKSQILIQVQHSILFGYDIEGEQEIYQILKTIIVNPWS